MTVGNTSIPSVKGFSTDMNDRDKKIWARFIHLLNIDTFGEEAIIMEKKQTKNLLGSVEKHRKIFEQACEEIDDEAAG